MAKFKDNFDEKYEKRLKRYKAVFDLRKEYFLKDNDIEEKHKNTLKNFLNLLKENKIDTDNDDNDSRYKDCFEALLKIEIKGKEYKICITYTKDKNVKKFVPVLIDILTYDEKNDYFFKYHEDLPRENQHCHVCYEDDCKVEVINTIGKNQVGISYNKVYFILTCSNYKDGPINEEKLRKNL